MVTRSPVALRLSLLVCALAFAMPGLAQTTLETETPEPAHVAYVDGAATIARDGRAEQATINVPLVSGDQLRTQEGRVEVLFGDASVLDVDHFTSLDFLSDELLRLLDGRIRLTVAGRDRIAYRIDTPGGAVRIDTPGEYRIALLGESSRRPDVELITIRGYATLVNDLGETGVRAGERAFATASMAPSYAQAYNSATWDAFDRWAQDRRDERTGTTSAQYLPDDVRGYAASFDRYGDWRYEETYGYVWYPRVHVEWRPYSYGRWSFYGPWGWTWIAYDPWWGWPTHHYGRWGFRANAWFWIPSRRWGPAHVYWASAPGYVGWCPLGWNGRPVFNIINVGFGIGGRRHYDPYRAWTVVPRHRFASRGDLRQYAVPRDTIARAVPRWSVETAAAPVRPEGITAAAKPIYSAGRSRTTRGADLSGPPREPERLAPQSRSRTSRGADLSGPPREPERLAPQSRSRTSRGADLSGPPREPERLAPQVERATPPPSSGVLSAPAAPAGADRASPRYRSPDLGPGGADRAPEDRARSRSGYAPRGVPDGGPGYAPRGVPRSTAPAYTPAPRERTGRGADLAGPPREPERLAPQREYDRPVRRNPEYSRPSSPPPSAPSGPDRPTYSRPSYGPPPSASAPRGGGSAGGGGDRPSRAVPRGGGSAGSARPPSGSSSSGSGSGSGGHSRRRPG